jgi:hypothetical protein
VSRDKSSTSLLIVYPLRGGLDIDLLYQIKDTY